MIRTSSAAIRWSVLVGLGVFLGNSPARSQAEPTQAKNDEAGVTALLGALVEAYNKADAKALEGLFAPDAVSIDSDGNETTGAEAIVAQYAAAFEGGATAKLAGQGTAVRFVTPVVARVTGLFQLLDDSDAPFCAGHYSLLATKTEGKWRIADLHDYSVIMSEPASNEEQLQELAWMVGDWVDQSEDMTVTTKIAWAENRNFLVRTYTLEIDGEPAASGTQWIGWDPSTEQIKSWVFDSEGGHGQGIWTSVGEAWVIKATGVLRSGDSTSATQIIEKVNGDVTKFSSRERVVGGELLPDIPEVFMVRKPPEPAPATIGR